MQALSDIVQQWVNGGGRLQAAVGPSGRVRNEPISWTIYMPQRPSDGVFVYRGLRTDPVVKQKVANGSCDREDRFLVWGTGNNYITRNKTPPSNIKCELHCLTQLAKLRCR